MKHAKPFFVFLAIHVVWLLCSCVTTTVTRPDGTVVKTTSQDPAVAGAIAAGLAQGAAAGFVQNLPKGFSK